VGTPYNIEDVTQGFPQGPYGFAPVFLFHANWVSDSSTWVNVTMDLDAATILAACSSGQLTSQSTVVEIGNSFFYPTYDGWNMGGMPFSNMVGNYGSTPAMTPPSDFAVGFSNGSSGGIFSHFNPLNVVGTWTPTSVQKVIDAGARLQVGINLYPLDVAPSYGSVVVTEPYELRQRNLPLFKLHVYGPGVGGESPPTFDVKMFGSQGTPNESNDLREWCPMNINYMNNAGLYLDNLVVHVPTDQHYPNMPDNYGGMAIWVPKEIVGPWNYIRFVLTPSEGRINSDYTNCYLTITAAARELY
jgi:hypothetical protein